MVTLYVPQDASAISVGANAVAERLATLCPDATIVRNGSRGLSSLEPLVEIDDGSVRYAFANVTVADCDTLFAGDVPSIDHPRSLGVTDELSLLTRQTRLTFRRVGKHDPCDFAAYCADGGLTALKMALGRSGQQIVDAVKASGLRGRGGAGFPTGIKWQTVHDVAADDKYIVCNADEGDSGTFADRLLIEGDPFMLIEGMVIAGLAVGATQGYIYLRSEYPNAAAILRRAIAIADEHGLTGTNILGSGKRFSLRLRIGAGAYICGEETSLLESLEGKRGVIRYKPPLPAVEGLFGKPTVVNNVITLATIPAIVVDDGAYHASLGVGKSRGTLTVQLGGNARYGGLYELPFGITLADVINDIGGGTASGRPVKTAQVGGPLGAYLPPDAFDTPLDYEAFAAREAMVGHGGVVVFDDTVNMAEQARFAMQFCAIESCGKCTPCRIGSTRGVEVIDAIRAADGAAKASQITLLHDLCDTMEEASLCALGGLTPLPVRSALVHFAADF